MTSSSLVTLPNPLKHEVEIPERDAPLLFLLILAANTCFVLGQVQESLKKLGLRYKERVTSVSNDEGRRRKRRREKEENKKNK